MYKVRQKIQGKEGGRESTERTKAIKERKREEQ